MGDVTVEDATISGKAGLINTMAGDITLKNTNVPDGGNFMGIYTETGDITIESCNVTIYGATAVDEATIPIALGEGGGTFTVKDSVLDLRGNSFAIMSPVGSGVFENVSGKIEVAGNAAYAMMFGGNVSMKGCDLEISCRATDEAACGISMMGDINIEESTLKIETRTTDESAICIGGMESPNTNVNVLDSTLELKASGPNAAGFYTNGVKLQQSITKVEATASATGTGFAAGVVAGEGRVLVNGGQLEVLATGPVKVEEGQPTVGILMGNAVLAPELIGADVKLIGNQAICAYPDLTLYGREYGAFASNDFSGAGETDFTKENIEAIRFLHIYPLYEVKIDGNGGEGEMFESELLYGEYTLPENAFTAPDGKHFRGWSLSADGDLLEGESIWLRDDITLYAIWESEYEETTDAGGETTGGDHTHDFGDAWKYSADGHYKECACGEKQHSGAHTDSNGNGFCDVCGGVMPAEGLGAGAIVG
ncbi:MAG: hypothetical protein J6B77_02565, partial [Clostridia bacterium]|nr:hypothetical protein [Clostridia bacterium]